MPTVTCPRCGRWLTVSESAPRVLSCPICLARIENPQGWAGGSTPPPLPLRPLRVIPIEQQVHQDASVASYLLFAVAAVLGGAAWLTLMLPGTRSFGLIIAAAFAFVLVTAIMQLRHPESEGVQKASAVIGMFAGGCFKIGLILLGVLLLLVGACAVLLASASMGR